MADIFVSYARSTAVQAQQIAEALRGLGWSVWLDDELPVHRPYSDVIEERLRSAKAVVVVWSADAAKSQWVRAEADVARMSGALVQLSLDGVLPPLPFNQIQCADMSGWTPVADTPAWRKVVSSVAELVGGPAPAFDASPGWLAGEGAYVAHAGGVVEPAPPKAPGVPRRLLLAGGAALVPLAVAGAWWLSRRRPPPPAAIAGPSAHSIAVLAFANLSGDPAQDYFSDGLSEELIDTLARLKPLEVVARTSSFKFKGSNAGSGEIGARLGVAHILDGSVRRDGKLVRVSTQLVEASTGFERWSQTYDRELKDILAVQTEIAQAVAEAMKIQLLGADIAAFSLGGAANAEAYDDYLRGMRLFDNAGSEAVYRSALAQFDAAVAADSAFAGAQSGRARCLLELANQYTPPAKLRAAFNEALTAARRAVALAPALAGAQATLADVLTNANLDFAGAKQAFAQAMQTGSGDADILTRFGQFSCDIGDFGSGLPAVRRATVLDPLNPRVFRSLGYALGEARKYADSIAAMRRALELNPAAAGAHAAIGDALLQQGQTTQAQAEYALEPLAWLRLTGQAIVLHRVGDASAAQAALSALVADPGSITFYQQAQIFAQWGDTDRAIGALNQSLTAGDSGIVLMKTDPMLDPIRRDPRFEILLSRLGLGR